MGFGVQAEIHRVLERGIFHCLLPRPSPIFPVSIFLSRMSTVSYGHWKEDFFPPDKSQGDRALLYPCPSPSKTPQCQLDIRCIFQYVIFQSPINTVYGALPFPFTSECIEPHPFFVRSPAEKDLDKKHAETSPKIHDVKEVPGSLRLYGEYLLSKGPTVCRDGAFFKTSSRGTWVAQLVKRPTSARSRSRGPWVRAPRRALG